jgi:hypothetical protein
VPFSICRGINGKAGSLCSFTHPNSPFSPSIVQPWGDLSCHGLKSSWGIEEHGTAVDLQIKGNSIKMIGHMLTDPFSTKNALGLIRRKSSPVAQMQKANVTRCSAAT